MRRVENSVLIACDQPRDLGFERGDRLARLVVQLVYLTQLAQQRVQVFVALWVGRRLADAGDQPGRRDGEHAGQHEQRLGVRLGMVAFPAADGFLGKPQLRGEIGKLEAKGRLDSDSANKLRGLVTGTTDKSLYADCDFVIEAVFEEVGVKQQVFGEIEQIIAEDAILAQGKSPGATRWHLEYVLTQAFGEGIEHYLPAPAFVAWAKEESAYAPSAATLAWATG